MKKNKNIIILTIISVVLLVASYLGAKFYRKHIDESDGQYRQYMYTENSVDECLNVTVSETDAWVKLIPDDYVLDSHFEEAKFAQKNDNDEAVCNGRTVEVTLDNISEYRINKWDFIYDVPCDMYLDKIWNGTVEVHQFKETNVDTISTKELPNVDTELSYITFDELQLIPLKKGDRIIYHPADYEYPLAEQYNSNGEATDKKIGFIVYTEDDSYRFSDFKIRYYVVKGLDEYPLYAALTLAVMVFGVLSLAFVIYLIVSIRYDRMHQHDMDIISQSIGTFSKFIDSKDRYTNNHSYRVAGYSKLIAQRLGLSENECEDIYYIGLLHDTGKIVIDDKILNKPGRLTSQEFEIIKSHTTKGADILKDFTAIKNITVGALYHHERYDGKGYPSGIEGESIPLVARIIAVADAYDAMSSNRCYRAQLDKERIVDQLVVNKGKQFDPKIVDVFLTCIENGEADSIRRSCIESR